MRAVPIMLAMALTVASVPGARAASSSVSFGRHGLAIVSSSSVGTHGLVVVGQKGLQFSSQDDSVAMAFNAALNYAYKNRTDFGYPWVDETSRTVLFATADDAAVSLVPTPATLDVPGFNVDSRPARASIADLDSIGDDVTHLGQNGVPNADLIWMTFPDQLNNRLVITVQALDSDLLAALATRYGTDLIEVQVRDAAPASTASRDSDSPPFWGGAKVSTSTGYNCTTGFAWDISGASGMLTAAHCIYGGGTVSYPYYSTVGYVTSGSRENWSKTDGTQYYTGQSVFRGDVALIQYYSYSSSPVVYDGAAGTSTHDYVSQKASRWSNVGDAVCINGVTTGGWCGVVTATGANVWYLIDGINVWARHVNEADAIGPTCPTHGDSGAPAYRTLGDGTLAAVGIFSGDITLGVDCSAFFTDIWDAYYGLPGDIKVH